jgi:hypothetical protein
VITSISPTLTPSISNPSLNKTAASASQPAVTAEQIHQAQAQGGATFDDPSLTATFVDLSSMEPKIEPYGELRIEQKRDAGHSMETIKQELENIDTMIAKRRPDLAGSWDFKLVDGKFKVTGLNTDDTQWLERALNANTALQSAAESFVETAVQNLQASDANPARDEFNYATGHMENYTFYDVKSQLSEQLSFRSLLTQSDQIIDSSKVTMEAYDRGDCGLSVAATLLTASNQAIEGRPGLFYTDKYDPRQG